eukprot:5244633-Alexandrium_andersonii.AAC.1
MLEAVLVGASRGEFARRVLRLGRNLARAQVIDGVSPDARQARLLLTVAPAAVGAERGGMEH